MRNQKDKNVKCQENKYHILHSKNSVGKITLMIREEDKDKD